MKERKYIKIGVAGPVGSGKTALIEKLTRAISKDYNIGVVTNDIYTKEDAKYLEENSLLDAARIIGVETGGCPHRASCHGDYRPGESAQGQIDRRYDLHRANRQFTHGLQGADNAVDIEQPFQRGCLLRGVSKD